MSIFYFHRPTYQNKNRIFIGINDTEMKYRIGHKPILVGNKIQLKRHFYEIKEDIDIVEKPDFAKIDINDRDILEFYNII